MRNLILYIFLLLPFLAISQEITQDSIPTTEIVKVEDGKAKFDSISLNYLTAKNPMRASLYSAILPGAGQIYNGKWWKAPIVWGLLGTGIGFISHYNSQYKEYRGYYLDKLYGYEIDNPTIENLSVETLATIQDDHKRTRDYAIALTALVYILNIVDATVDAHLYGINKDPDLSFEPVMLQNQQSSEVALGVGFNFKF